MRDITEMLTHVMQKENCSSTCALLMLTEKDNEDGVCIFQPEPSQETCGGLCDKGNIQTN